MEPELKAIVREVIEKLLDHIEKLERRIEELEAKK